MFLSFLFIDFHEFQKIQIYAIRRLIKDFRSPWHGCWFSVKVSNVHFIFRNWILIFFHHPSPLSKVYKKVCSLRTVLIEPRNETARQLVPKGKQLDKATVSLSTWWHLWSCYQRLWPKARFLIKKLVHHCLYSLPNRIAGGLNDRVWKMFWVKIVEGLEQKGLGKLPLNISQLFDRSIIMFRYSLVRIVHWVILGHWATLD